VAVGVALAASACSTPSSKVDGGDLLGVFEHDAGASDASADAASSAAARRARKPKPAAPPQLAGVVTSAEPRLPIERACVTASGSPDRELRRVVGRPACRGAEVLEWKDGDGSPRYACVISPKNVELRAPLPLVVFFHGAHDDPTSVDKKTTLRRLGGRFDLTADPARAGFIVLAVQGRAIQAGRQGATFDAAYTETDNVDVAAVDHFMGALDARKLIDRRRIYTLGNGAGGLMAATYAMVRADRVAASAVFASDAPRAEWQCTEPTPPMMVAYRACDTVVPCESVERWLRARETSSVEVAALRLGVADGDEPLCTVRNKCTERKGAAQHARWPRAREEDILRFFKRHSLAVAPSTAGLANNQGKDP
jgi:poly(3-hydroxybutyrate) depolymerase